MRKSHRGNGGIARRQTEAASRGPHTPCYELGGIHVVAILRQRVQVDGRPPYGIMGKGYSGVGLSALPVSRT
ncbi:hypothetical protein BD309DRAFT_992613 [Dichomitus squalens]|uniref:Uncharacterized protein n=1 Tax=Dichomitus squalens TaxID=114155 RepID=A0A4Q9NJT1_9APHY|nr:hypothetical protein BD309DRAFT_992613 [Dichomitus squalens]TBU55703.1 hypothetical protein BD310DRAFT_825231 [Dichomitus squalens]